ncbi:MAG: sulfotransferase [Deltaproteobacteria bacterium]|nr:sulfotransferase [Deltaproteobacteria bacterium]
MLSAVRLADVCRRLKRGDEALPVLLPFAQAELGPHEASVVYHALADLHDAAGRWEQSFLAHRRGHALRGLSFDPAQQEAAVSAMIRNLGVDVLRGIPAAPGEATLPVLVLGMPRTGTSLVEQILAAHPAVYGAGELEDLRQVAVDLAGMIGAEAWYLAPERITAAQIERLGARYQADLAARAPGAARVVDKMPHNFYHLGLISRLLPGVRVLHCTRDPLDMAVSIYSQNFGPGLSYATKLEWIGAFYLQYLRLMEHWRQVADLQLLDVPYEEVVADPEGWARRIVAFVGLPWDDACARPHQVRRDVHTASHAQVRRPVYSSSVRRADRYGALLDPLRDLLGAATGE